MSSQSKADDVDLFRNLQTATSQNPELCCHGYSSCPRTSSLFRPPKLKQRRSMTPPVDEQEAIEEARALELQAREELEGDGCPPCYPECVKVPHEKPPEKYQTMVSYWQSLPGTSYLVLRAQHVDWQKFRADQKRARRFYGNGRLGEYMDQVRERRRNARLG